MKILSFCFFLTTLCCTISEVDHTLSRIDDIEGLLNKLGDIDDSENFQNYVRKLSLSYRECLERNGVKKASFESCVGPNYSRVGFEMNELLLSQKTKME